jgi:hypothetical protein
MEAMIVTKSCRSFAVTKEIEDTPLPPPFAKIPGGFFEGMPSTAAESTQ